MMIDLDDLDAKIEEATSGVLIFSVETARQFVSEIRSGRQARRRLAQVTATGVAGAALQALVAR